MAYARASHLSLQNPVINLALASLPSSLSAQETGVVAPFRFPAVTDFPDAPHASPLSNANIRGTMEKAREGAPLEVPCRLPSLGRLSCVHSRL